MLSMARNSIIIKNATIAVQACPTLPWLLFSSSSFFLLVIPTVIKASA
jgi:hypothetical protein